MKKVLKNGTLTLKEQLDNASAYVVKSNYISSKEQIKAIKQLIMRGFNFNHCKILYSDFAIKYFRNETDERPVLMLDVEEGPIWFDFLGVVHPEFV